MGEARRVVQEAVEAFNAHDEQRIRATYADDVVFEAPPSLRLEGADASTDYAMSWLRAFPDSKVTIHDEVAEGDWVAYRFTFEGTHTEPLAGPEGEIPPTNRRLVGRGAQLIRVQGGKVTEEHLYYDQVQVLTQLGLMPETAAAPV